MSEPPPLSIDMQAKFLAFLVNRCRNGEDGPLSDGAWIWLEARDIQELQRLATRLDRMAPHEAAIRRIVAGKK